MQAARPPGEFEVWPPNGGHYMFGRETLRQVAAHYDRLTARLDEPESISVRVLYHSS